MAGLLAGLLLLREHWDVAIYERTGEELASRGAGLTPHRALFDACKQAGVDITTAIGVESAGRLMLARDGSVTASNDMSQLFTSWGLLYRFLRAAFPDECYHNGAGVRAIEQHPAHATLAFEDGSSAEADWVIGADGLRSLVRETVAPESSLRYTGYAAWRGLVTEGLLPKRLRAQLERGMTFYVPSGEHFLGYTVAGPDDTLVRGERWYNWVWYRPLPAGDQYDDVFTDAHGELHELGIPPHKLRIGVIDELRRAADSRLPPQFRAVVGATERPFIQPIVELASARLLRGRCILIGDAAFTARPHIGLGVSKAAGDAATLARALSNPDNAVPVALAHWERARLAHGRAAVERSAALGCYLSGPARDAADAERYAYYRSPEVVLAQIAAADPDEIHPAGEKPS